MIYKVFLFLIMIICFIKIIEILKYKNRISINLGEIDEQLKKSKNKKEFNEYLISEIIITRVEEELLQSKINDIRSKIVKEGFSSVAINESISESASKGMNSCPIFFRDESRVRFGSFNSTWLELKRF